MIETSKINTLVVCREVRGQRWEERGKSWTKWVDIEEKANDNVTRNNTNCQFSFIDRQNGNDMSSGMMAGLDFAQGKEMIVFISFPDRFSQYQRKRGSPVLPYSH